MPSLHRRHSKHRSILRLLKTQGHPRVTPRLYQDRIERGLPHAAALTLSPNANEHAAEALSRWIVVGPQTPTERFAVELLATALLGLSLQDSPRWRWGDATYTEQTGVVELSRN